jgi:hypothetical protein
LRWSPCCCCWPGVRRINMISDALQTLNEQLTDCCAAVSDELNIFRTGLYEPYAAELTVLTGKMLLLGAEIEEFLSRTNLEQSVQASQQLVKRPRNGH